MGTQVRSGWDAFPFYPYRLLVLRYIHFAVSSCPSASLAFFGGTLFLLSTCHVATSRGSPPQSRLPVPFLKCSVLGGLGEMRYRSKGP